MNISQNYRKFSVLNFRKVATVIVFKCNLMEHCYSTSGWSFAVTECYNLSGIWRRSSDDETSCQ